MNDSMSVLLATTILALGGFGLYMYKSSDDSQDQDYNEDSFFGENFWGSDDKNDDDEIIDEDDDYKPRRKNAKTQRNRKTTGASRRRY
jgi:hypothetical protein